MFFNKIEHKNKIIAILEEIALIEFKNINNSLDSYNVICFIFSIKIN
jgi:hypothetical protein